MQRQAGAAAARPLRPTSGSAREKEAGHSLAASTGVQAALVRAAFIGGSSAADRLRKWQASEMACRSDIAERGREKRRKNRMDRDGKD